MGPNRSTEDGPVIEDCNRRFIDRLEYDRATVVGTLVLFVERTGGQSVD